MQNHVPTMVIPRRELEMALLMLAVRTLDLRNGGSVDDLADLVHKSADEIVGMLKKNAL